MLADFVVCTVCYPSCEEENEQAFPLSVSPSGIDTYFLETDSGRRTESGWLSSSTYLLGPTLDV